MQTRTHRRSRHQHRRTHDEQRKPCPQGETSRRRSWRQVNQPTQREKRCGDDRDAEQEQWGLNGSNVLSVHSKPLLEVCEESPVFWQTLRARSAKPPNSWPLQVLLRNLRP